jgi:hypothetical protein
MTSTGLHITPEEVWRWMPMGGRYAWKIDREERWSERECEAECTAIGRGR